MHNLFLGTAKHMFDLWLERNILSQEHLTTIESLVNKFTLPSDVGHLPTSISSGYGGFTANQWRNWIKLLARNLAPSDRLSTTNMVTVFSTIFGLPYEFISKYIEYIHKFCRTYSRSINVEATKVAVESCISACLFLEGPITQTCERFTTWEICSVSDKC